MKALRIILPISMFLLYVLCLLLPQQGYAAPLKQSGPGFASIVQASYDGARHREMRQVRNDRHEERHYAFRDDFRHRHDRDRRHDRHDDRYRHDRHDRHDHRSGALWIAWPGFFFGTTSHLKCR